MKPFNENNPQKVSFEKCQQILHGDVIIEKIKSLPDNFKLLSSEPNDALAYGESSGHLHKLFRIADKDGMDLPHFELKIGEGGIKYLKVNEPVTLKHQEHEARVIPTGLYVVRPQVEYDPFTKLARSVAD